MQPLDLPERRCPVTIPVLAGLPGLLYVLSDHRRSEDDRAAPHAHRALCGTRPYEASPSAPKTSDPDDAVSRDACPACPARLLDARLAWDIYAEPLCDGVCATSLWPRFFFEYLDTVPGLTSPVPLRTLHVRP